MKPTKKLPLFCVTGASCAGKTTVCNELFKNEQDYIVLESDIFWNDVYNTPEDDYRDYRSRWMKLAAYISQIGVPCVIFGACVPKQFENLPQRDLFSDIHYLAIVCDDDTLLHRMKDGRKVTDEKWIKSSVDFNKWLKENHSTTTPQITLLDTSDLTPSDAAQKADEWIRSKLNEI